MGAYDGHLRLVSRVIRKYGPVSEKWFDRVFRRFRTAHKDGESVVYKRRRPRGAGMHAKGDPLSVRWRSPFMWAAQELAWKTEPPAITIYKKDGLVWYKFAGERISNDRE